MAHHIPLLIAVLISLTATTTPTRPFLSSKRTLSNSNNTLKIFPLPSPPLELNNTHSSLDDNIRYFNYFAFLEDFGYVEYAKAQLDKDAPLTSVIVLAIKTYQKNFKLEPTGLLDDYTLRIMAERRCGNPDIVNNTNTMQPSPPSTNMYKFFDGSPRWDHQRLTYTLLPGFPEVAKPVIQESFDKWGEWVDLKFTDKTGSGEETDFNIGFFSGAHGPDCMPFEPHQGKSLAHAFPPMDGRIHFNQDQYWSFGPIEKKVYDFRSAAIHEIGHALGLHHSDEKDSVMYPVQRSHQYKHDLGHDDIMGITSLYPITRRR